MADSNRGRPVSVSVDDLYSHLRWSEEPCTVADFADEFDVTTETVRKRTSELENCPGVSTKKLGKAKVYWYSVTQSVEDRQFDGEEVGELLDSPDLDTAVAEYQRAVHQDTLHARAEWLDSRQSHADNRAATVSSVGEGVFYRAEIWAAFESYRSDTKLSLPNVYQDALDEAFAEATDTEPPENVFSFDPEKWNLDEDTFDYYVHNVELFGGEVEGLAECEVKMSHVSDFFEEQSKKDDPDANITVEQLDDVLPPFEQTLHAGDVFDDFVAGLWGFEW